MQRIYLFFFLMIFSLSTAFANEIQFVAYHRGTDKSGKVIITLCKNCYLYIQVFSKTDPFAPYDFFTQADNRGVFFINDDLPQHENNAIDYKIRATLSNVYHEIYAGCYSDIVPLDNQVKRVTLKGIGCLK